MGRKLVCVEANIGAGKTSLISNLKAHFKNNPKIIFLKEPVDDWEKIKDSNGNTMIQKFYSDQKAYAFSFQMMAYISRLALLSKAFEETADQTIDYIIISERSLYTDKLVFAKMLYEAGNIEEVNYQIYLKWFDFFAKTYPVDKIIHIETDPKVCKQRIKKRERHGEDGIPLEYLEKCDTYHHQMVHSHEVTKDILTIDGNVDLNTNPAMLDTWIETINKFITN